MRAAAAALSHEGKRAKGARETSVLQQKRQLPDGRYSELLKLRSALRSLEFSAHPAKENTFTSLLELCSRVKSLPEAKRLHHHISRHGLDRNIFFANFIISMYGHCGSVPDARLMFDNMDKRNVVSWNAMISVYGKHGHGKRAVRLLKRMHEDGLQPQKSTFLTALNACTNADLLESLIALHKIIAKQGYKDDIVVSNALINAYGKCGNAMEARKVFHEMKQRDIITWNSIISASSRNGQLKKALKLFHQMKAHNFEPDRLTFLNMLSGCTSVEQLEIGKEIHELILKCGYESDVFVGTALITMFGKCRRINDAWEAFETMHSTSVVSWNAMITAYTECGCHREALQLFWKMPKAGLEPNNITFTAILDACAGPDYLEEGRSIHFYARKCRLWQDKFVRSALINMYGKCGSLEEAQHVFGRIDVIDLVSATAMMGACALLGHADEAFKVLLQMIREGIKPNQVTYIHLLSVCADLATAADGRVIHSGLVEAEFSLVVEVCNALINMYSKCGCVEDARRVFDSMKTFTVISWTAMLDAYALHGRGKEALEIFRRMQQDGGKPDGVTYVSLLTACSHAGLIREAREHFFSMYLNYGIKPNSSHYSCMIDMFARVGRLDEAEKFTKNAPVNVGIVEWMALLGACKNYGDLERAERAAEQVLMLDPSCRTAYIILSNIYSMAGRWDDVASLKKRMEQYDIV
ncbi:hypothetical protein KP509_04G103400 [Ceratopteris richardii]|uniref:Pentatricopeptide repeat-containing protein n=1 Tax=Ceratopteris richardii TaxID=49495 RepID=A0A8T2V2D8_CERRI|nr:hypothetical protein KP509_04G103400 [Ceratopteris richardii]